VDEPVEHVLATIAQAFAANLSNQQRAELHNTMTKRELAAFDRLWCSTTDAEAFDAYRALVDVAGAKVLTLRKLLTEEQQQQFAMFMQGAAQYAEAQERGE
jgi:hypothetical protein